MTTMAYPQSVQRAGFADGDALFDAVLASPSGVVFSIDEYEDTWRRVETAVRQAHPARVKVPKHPVVPDAFVYRIVYDGHKVAFDQPTMPRRVRDLVGVLERLVTSHS